MKTLLYFLFGLLTILVSGQVGINTPNPEATLQVVGKPDDPKSLRWYYSTEHDW